MMVIDFQLMSAVTGHKLSLGIILIDNQKQYRKSTGMVADYRVRAYPKKVSLDAIIKGAKPHRIGMVIAHPKHTQPVWSLMAKALKELGYG